MNYPDLAACELLTKIIAHDDQKAPEGSDAATKAFYANDRKDLRKIRSLYRRGKWAEAADKVRSVDTAVRELIPERMWDDLMGFDS